MKKISILAILMIAVIMLVGCDSDNKMVDTTPVEFGISVGSALQSRALVATNPATAKVDAVYISFIPAVSDASYTEGATTGGDFTYEGDTYEVSLMGTPSKSGDTISCSQTGTKYLSQGQWTIKAVAVSKEGTATDYSDDVVLYYGETSVWVNKKTNSASLVLLPVEDSTKTGTVSFGNGANLIQTHASSDNGTGVGLSLHYDIDGTTGTIDCSGVSSEIASFGLTAVSGIEQGAHLVKVVEYIDDVPTTGGYVIPVFVVGGETSYITGSFNPSEWISASVSATIELGADVKGTLNTSSPKAPVFTLTGGATGVTYQWYVDGVANGGTTTTGDLSGLTTPGRHNVQIVAKSSKGMFSIGYILKIDGAGNASVV